MNCGSGDSLNSSARWGLRPNACQMACTDDGDMPTALAIDRVDQCVASAGADSKVSTMTSSTAASPMVRGGPGRGSSQSPSRRRSANRERHFDTVAGWHPSPAAISLL